MNWLLLIISFIVYGFVYSKYSQRDKLQKERNNKIKPNRTVPMQKEHWHFFESTHFGLDRGII